MTTRILSASIARKKLARFAITLSRESQSVKPRFKILSRGFCALERTEFPATKLTPPRLVLKPCTSQLKLPNAVELRICNAPERSKTHPAAWVDSFPLETFFR